MALIVLFAPLLGAMIAGFLGRATNGRAVQVTVTSLIILSAMFSWLIYIGADPHRIMVMRWMGRLEADWVIRVDSLSALMLVLTTTVSALVHLYALTSPGDTPRPNRLFAHLAFFTFAMGLLVSSDGLLQVFVGWQAVNVAAYLLMGFHKQIPMGGQAAMQSFILNRVSDVALLLGLLLLYTQMGSLQFEALSLAAELSPTHMTLAALLFTFAAMVKSAQIFGHVWLTEVQVSTPVAALLQGAMTAAGVFLLCRLSPLLDASAVAQTTLITVGLLTAVLGALCALVQNDVRRLFAFSTCAELGFAITAIGLGAYWVALIYLLIHGLLKTLMILACGSIWDQNGPQLKDLSGLRYAFPRAFWLMLFGTLGLSGAALPLLGTYVGFGAKAAVLEQTDAAVTWALIAAYALSALYAWRLLIRLFFGPRQDSLIPSARALRVPLYTSAALVSVISLFMLPRYVETGTQLWLSVTPLLITCAAFMGVWLCYVARPYYAVAVKARFKGLNRLLIKGGLIEELYDDGLNKPALELSEFVSKRIDGGVIDGVFNDLIPRVFGGLAAFVSRLQTGRMGLYFALAGFLLMLFLVGAR